MQIFVISDLHLGGKPYVSDEAPGSQICRAYPELTRFIDWVSRQGDIASPVELVINGDIVDFLMEDDYGADNEATPWLPDENLIIEKFSLIVERTRSGTARGPFEAMADLLAQGNWLTFILGNHDIELALPAVRRHLESNVLHTERGGHFRFIYDGEAYVRGDVLIEHGNRYDPWNIIDHSALRQVRSMLSRGLGEQMLDRESGNFTPPPGSIMVNKIINILKHQFSFIDLLKPENEAVIPILMALHPNFQHILNAIWQNYKSTTNKFSSPAEPVKNGQLTAAGATLPVSLKDCISQSFGNEAVLGMETNNGSPLGAVEAWNKIKELSSNISLWLNNGEGYFNKANEAPRKARLKMSLNKMRGELAISTNEEDSKYLNAAIELATFGKMKCIVFGHTHLPKDINFALDNGDQCRYFNTGTWADVMTVPLEILENSPKGHTAFDKFMEDIKSNNLSAYRKRELTYVHIELINNKIGSASLQAFS